GATTRQPRGTSGRFGMDERAGIVDERSGIAVGAEAEIARIASHDGRDSDQHDQGYDRGDDQSPGEAERADERDEHRADNQTPPPSVAPLSAMLTTRPRRRCHHGARMMLMAAPLIAPQPTAIRRKIG